MKTKKIIFLLIFAFITCNSIAQGNGGAWGFKIPNDNYDGKRIKYELAVKNLLIDDSASSRLWCRVDLEKGMGFFNNMWVTPIRKNNWQVYSIEGTVDKGAKTIYFGGIQQFNGIFYFDKLIVSIEEKPGKWKTVFQNSFEDGKIDCFNNNKLYEISIANEGFDGKKCLKVVGTKLPNYGVNAKAGHYAQVNGFNMYYETYGEGKPLFIIHAGGNSLADMKVEIEYFSQKYKVYAIDCRGHGNSIDTKTDLTYSLIASDMYELVKSLNLDSVYIYGHQEGGSVGLIFALNYPDKVKRLAALSPNFIPDSAAINPVVYKKINTFLTSKNNNTAQRIKLTMNSTKENLDKLKNIKTEVLLISADRDWVELPQTIDIFRNIPNSNLCVVPGSTMNMMKEKPELLQKVVSDFFEKPFKTPSTASFFK